MLIIGLSLTFNLLTCISIAICLESSISIVRTIDTSLYIRLITILVINNNTIVIINSKAKQSRYKE